MSTTYVGQIERGNRDPGLGALHRLADALGISLASLVSPEPSEPLAAELARLSPGARRVVSAVVRELQVYDSTRD